MVTQKQSNKTGAVFAKYVSLNVLGMIGLSCYILADTFFVARGLGANGLTALNLAIPLYSFINGTGLMIGMGGATRFSISGSKGKQEGKNEIFSQAVYMALGAAIFFILTGVFLSEGISSLLGADQDVHQMTTVYLRTMLIFSPMFIMNNVLICFIRNDNNPNLTMAAMLTGSFSNIILDYIFVFPFGMGIFGAAFATGLAPIISMFVLSRHFIQKKNSFWLKRVKVQLKNMRDYVALGISALITELSSGLVIIIFNIIILKIAGNIGVAAYSIIANLALVVLAIFTGVSQGIQPLISRNFGAEKQEEVEKIYKYAVLTALIIAIAVYVITLCFAREITGIFNSGNDQTLENMAVQGLYLYFTGFIFAGFNIITAVYFSATAYSAKAFFISMARGFVFIVPISILLSVLFKMNGVWLAFTCTEFLTAIISVCLKKRP